MNPRCSRIPKVRSVPTDVLLQYVLNWHECWNDRRTIALDELVRRNNPEALWIRSLGPISNNEKLIRMVGERGSLEDSNPIAMYLVGQRKSMDLVRRSAEAGYGPALMMMYEFTEDEQWLKRACRENHAEALYQLGFYRYAADAGSSEALARILKNWDLTSLHRAKYEAHYLLLNMDWISKNLECYDFTCCYTIGKSFGGMVRW